MTQPTNSDTLESDFITQFKELKKQRNNHLIDEPDFDLAVEQLAADTYAHPTAENYCCACEYDIAALTEREERLVREARTDQVMRDFLKHSLCTEVDESLLIEIRNSQLKQVDELTKESKDPASKEK